MDVTNTARSEGVTNECLSALVDGEANAGELASACAAWAQDAETRARWHRYHVIGDVLRSDDLASGEPHDAAFLASLRARLAQEPVVFAPSSRVAVPAAVGRSARNWRWVAPAAVAASVVAVSGWMLRPSVPSDRSIAGAPAPAAPAPVTVAANPRSLPAELAPVRQATMLRDPQLDGYFAAHKQFSGGSALGMPSGFVRPAMVEAPAR